MVILSLVIELSDNACFHLAREVNNKWGEDGAKNLCKGVGEKEMVW